MPTWRYYQRHRASQGGWRTNLDPDVRIYRALADQTRARILRILRATHHPLDAHILAGRLGLHLTTVRAHLDVLTDAGLVTSATEQRTTPGRPRRLYQAVADVEPGAEGYRLLAEMLASHLAGTSADVKRDAVAAGRTWGTYLVDRPAPYATATAETARAEIVQLMDRLGFQPEVVDEGNGGTIRLNRCPFFDVAQRHSDVVCSLHLGLLRGALRALRAPLEARDLRPFVAPSLCVAHLVETQPLDRALPGE